MLNPLIFATVWEGQGKPRQLLSSIIFSGVLDTIGHYPTSNQTPNQVPISIPLILGAGN